MAKLIHPGIYVHDVPGMPGDIEQVGTSTAIFIGYTEKITQHQPGDLKMQPVAIDTYSRFVSIFGNPSANTFVADSVDLFFQNGGRECIIISAGDFQSAVNLNDLKLCLNISKTVKGQLMVIPDAVLLPGAACSTLQQLMLQSAAELQDRFCILDTKSATNISQDMLDFRTGIGINNLAWGAAYYPWLVLHNNKQIPPSGCIAGIFAQVDTTRGVWKAPANISITGLKVLSYAVDNAEQDSMNIDPLSGKSINAIRLFPGRGILVWGARTLAGNNAEWKYVPVKRLCICVEQSIQQGTGWVVFEPNDANTWLKLQSTVSSYLARIWRQGALAGTTADQAFFVKCGLHSSMTTQDITNGRLIVEIGMAVLRPGEFIIIRVIHKMSNH